MHKFKPQIAVCLALVIGLIISPMAWSAGFEQQEQYIDLKYVREQSLLGNQDYLLAHLDLETAKLQLVSAVADNLQRASAISIKQAESSVRSAQRHLATAGRNAQLDAEIKYYNLIKATRQLEIAKEALTQAQEQLRIINVKQAEGMATNIDVRQAEQLVLQSENSYQSATKNLSLVKIQLNSALGLDLNRSLVATDQDFSYVPLSLSLDEVLALALANNPMLLELEEQLEIAKLDEKAARNDYTAPLVTQSKTLQREKLELQVARLKNQIYIQTMELWNNVQALSDLYLANSLAVEIAEENYRIIQVRFEDGLEIPVNLLGGRLELARANQQALNSLFDYNVAKSQLMINLGFK